MSRRAFHEGDTPTSRPRKARTSSVQGPNAVNPISPANNLILSTVAPKSHWIAAKIDRLPKLCHRQVKSANELHERVVGESELSNVP